jgi:phospholipid/cholesterol/gamma-HCH transport system ATP-binding protein
MQSDSQSDFLIELDRVGKRFGRATVLEEVTLQVPRGETTVLLGPSGAGKTVTISHIVGLILADRGTVTVDGRNLARIDDAELNALRQRMAVVLQGTLPFTCGLFFSLNVFENVAFPLRQRHRLSEDQVRERTLTHLGMVGLRERADAMPDQLSAGMCKRVAIARALALEPELLIIDDFDSGIDGVRLKLLCQMLKDYATDSGATLFVSTHSMSAARMIADRIAVIHEGRMVSAGPAAEQLESTEPLVHQLVTGATEGPITLRDV